ncbi:hypothetical protein CPB86DRAFT_761215 [Serendipita vermifera]|nr:hypothetical protein CPB86DRAFT_761215 [Serendipita vermifera]
MLAKSFRNRQSLIIRYSCSRTSSARLFHSNLLRRNDNKDPVHKEKDPELEGISDHEWELRAGRAFSIIRDTLPDFFKIGLVERVSGEENAESIYSPRILLLYTPPTRLPPLHIEGLPLYHASSSFMRHTLNMFYNNLRIELRRAKDINGGHRERKFTIGMGIIGTSRIGGSHAEWDVASTYHISPITGLVHKHVVESIQPAPHIAAYDALDSALSALTELPGKPIAPESLRTYRTLEASEKSAKP